MSVLVAGGMGFIGTNLCKLLKDRNISYSVIDLKGGVDVCTINASDFDTIVLLAGEQHQIRHMYSCNLRIYQWLARHSVNIIFTSSAAVYGDSKTPHVEDEPALAPTIYGKSKLLGEQIIKDTQSRYTILRLANVYGNGEGNGAIDIFQRGGNVIYGDGEDIRDYISVQKVCEAIVTALLKPERYAREIFNISSFEPKTTYAAFNEFGKGKPKYLPPRPFDVSYSVLDNTKAKKAGLL